MMVLVALAELLQVIVKFAPEHRCVTIAAANRLTGASRNTLKQHFRNITERGICGRSTGIGVSTAN